MPKEATCSKCGKGLMVYAGDEGTHCLVHYHVECCKGAAPAPADLVSRADVLAVVANEVTNIQSAADILTLRDYGGLHACKHIAERITAHPQGTLP